ncbi:hypothetical protein RO3G_11382 [Lichtheimia corymbifera JMRC:FSU:9682]|uniref:F-box domain-containing protein n=1 Tax=Lichtheimia corymbifera JMRC:FSU:9682 TaxID=1263082 RepID=A0A068RWG4_9FUNG|nr:hypothetical protein RO3G_11382 [Lichtheimia corymbifera JMRC:FSU:9682]
MSSYNKKSMLSILAPEVLLHVMSFLPLTDVYRIRSVCKTWQAMGEEYIFLRIREQRNTVDVKIGDKRRGVIVKLVPHSYDRANRIVEFRPISMTAVPMTVDATNPFSTCHRRMQIHFSEWKSSSQASDLVTAAASASNTSISLQDKALILFHMGYNPALERTYELPSWGPSESPDHFVGDKGLILSLSYVHPSTLNDPSAAGVSFYSYPNHTTSIPTNSPPHIQIQWLRVTLSWILSGIRSDIAQTQIYPQRYGRLSHALARHGCFKYDPLSEPVLSHIVHNETDEPWSAHQQQHSRPASICDHPRAASLHFPTINDTFSDASSSTSSDPENDTIEDVEEHLPAELIEYVQVHTHECHTRLSRLQHMLEGAGVDALVLWKYTFAKSYVVGNGSLVGEEDVVRRIQDSENEWRLKRISLTRRLGIAQ